MSEYTPLTKEDREHLLTLADKVARAGNYVSVMLTAEQARRYEATVEDLEMRLALTEEDADFCNIKRNEAESRLAEAQRLAELGEAVEGMELGDGLFREGEHEWRVRSDLEYETSNWEIVDNAPTPLAAFEAMKQKRAEYEAAVARADDAVLRAAKGDAQTKPAP